MDCEFELSCNFLQITPSPEPEEEPDMEFIIVREEFSSSDDEPPEEPLRELPPKSVRSFRSFQSFDSKDTETSLDDTVRAFSLYSSLFNTAFRQRKSLTHANIEAAFPGFVSLR